jgi:hypothetical protein
MKITIHYLVRGESEPRALEVAPTDYFEPVEPGESLEAGGVPLLDHARDYLGGIEVAWTEVIVESAAGSSSIREEYSPTGRVAFWHRSDSDGYREIGLTSQQAPDVIEIARLVASEGGWKVSYWGRITRNADGTESE